MCDYTIGTNGLMSKSFLEKANNFTFSIKMLKMYTLPTLTEFFQHERYQQLVPFLLKHVFKY